MKPLLNEDGKYMAESKRSKSFFGPRASFAFFVFIPIVFFLGALYRAKALESVYAASRECHFCFFWHALQHDCLILGPVVVLSFFAFSQKRSVSVLSRLVIVLVAFLYALDITVFETFGRQRLHFDTIPRFANPSAWMPFIRAPEKSSLLFVYFGLLGLILICLIPIRAMFSRRTLVVCLSIGAVFTLLGLFPRHFDDPLASQVLSFLEVNNHDGEKVQYSEAFKQKILQEGSIDSPVYKPGLSQKRDVILVIVESLSSYQSSFFSGIQSFTPHLDAIAREHTAYTNFHANSFCSNAGRRAIIGGSLALPWSANHRHDENMIQVFKTNQFRTAVFYAAMPTVDGFEQLMAAVGPDDFSSSEDPFYNGDPRSGFRSISDARIYANVLDYLKRTNNSQLKFITVVTASSHQPYHNPQTRERGVKAAFKYADAELGNFYEELRAARFFDHGTLIITGDHRAMTSVSDEERKRFGAAARSMIPLVIVDSQEPKPQIISGLFQQADLLTTLDYYASPGYSKSPWRGNLLTGETARSVFHCHGDLLDEVDVFCGEKHTLIRLNGDQSKIVGGDPSNSQALRRLNFERIYPGSPSRRRSAVTRR
jgi:lipoteichoic acid synthase